MNLAFVDGHVKSYPAESPTQSSKIYAAHIGATCTSTVGFAISGTNPTFNVDAP